MYTGGMLGKSRCGQKSKIAEFHFSCFHFQLWPKSLTGPLTPNTTTILDPVLMMVHAASLEKNGVMVNAYPPTSQNVCCIKGLSLEGKTSHNVVSHERSRF